MKRLLLPPLLALACQQRFEECQHQLAEAREQVASAEPGGPNHVRELRGVVQAAEAVG
jgi:hypothetical protein